MVIENRQGSDISQNKGLVQRQLAITAICNSGVMEAPDPQR